AHDLKRPCALDARAPLVLACPRALMSLSEKVQYFARTDVGRLRDHNEDNYLIDKKLSLSVVADGMGGHAAGEVASALAVRIIHEEIKAHREVIEAHATEGSPTRAGVKEILA